MPVTETYLFLLGKQLHKVIWEDPSFAIDLSTPPAFVFKVLIQHTDYVPFFQAQLIWLLSCVGKPYNCPFHWKDNSLNAKPWRNT